MSDGCVPDEAYSILVEGTKQWISALFLTHMSRGLCAGCSMTAIGHALGELVSTSIDLPDGMTQEGLFIEVIQDLMAGYAAATGGELTVTKLDAPVKPERTRH